ncbi:MAG: hypothetical protein GKS05_10555 [Nitrospirales bacterium]|nr:hypothetical protein [Nitrospirales bacterium]
MERLTCHSLNILCLFLLFSACHVPQEVVGSEQQSLSTHIDAAHWGIRTSKDIAYLSLGILHETQGDKLVIHDVRSRRPQRQLPNNFTSRSPEFKNGVFLVSHFNRGNRNHLGGYFNTFSRPPSQAAIGIDPPSPDETPTLNFTYSDHAPGFAGFWIHLFDFKAPPEKRVFLDTRTANFLTFSIRGESGTEALALKVADQQLEAKEDSHLVGNLGDFLPKGEITQTWQQVWVPLRAFPHAIDRQYLAGLVFLAYGHGQIFIKDLAFTTEQNVPIPTAQQPTPLIRQFRKALWLWETEQVLNNPEERHALLDFCAQQGITDLFMQIPYEAEQEQQQWRIMWQTEKFPSLLRALHRAGVRVDALDGDRRYVLKEFHGRLLMLIDHLRHYNEQVLPEERFDGVRFDNEPYLLPQFAGVQKKDVLRQYLLFLQKARPQANQAGLTFGVDIPFWFDSNNTFFEPSAELEGRPMTEHILDHVDNIAIMDYRTQAYGADSVLAHAQTELTYAAEQKTPVFVALETVPLPDETLLRFDSHGKQDSCVVLEDAEDQRIQIYWLPTCTETDPLSFLTTQKHVQLRQAGRIAVPADKLTFAQRSPDELRHVMQQVTTEFAHLPSFVGFAIHSYESYHVWVQGKHVTHP